jgi:hypothetical protein|tara:strand:- start:373 stop:570 length:198 start_codon:yes stop_codon:yes gene_type:complete
MKITKLLIQDAKKSFKYFIGRFYFERVDSRFLPILPCLYIDSESRTLEIAWIAWSFNIYLGNENK